MAGIAPEKLSISDIKSRLLNLAQTSLYRVTITPGPGVSGFISNNLRAPDITPSNRGDIDLLCTEASLPGSSVATHDVTSDYHGVTEKMGYRRIYDESLDLTFYVDRDYKVIEYFDGWINYIVGEGSTLSRDNYKKKNAYYRMNYPINYKGKIHLIKFEKDLHFKEANTKTSNTIMQYTFVEAFPTNIVSMPVSYDQSQILKCTVSFSYIRYVRERLNIGSSGYTKNRKATGNPDVPIDDFSAVINGLDDQGYATVYSPFGSSVTFFDESRDF